MVEDKSACGVGFVVSRKGAFAHETLQKGLTALKNVEHRGASAADGLSGDGAGIMADIPFELLGYQRGEVAVATLFIPIKDLETQRLMLQIFEETFGFWGMKVLDYRTVPVDTSVLGPMAKETMPKILHVIIKKPEHSNSDDAFEKMLYRAKQATLTKIRKHHTNPQFYFNSLSASTIVYKALTTSNLLDRFYLDLQNPAFKTRFTLFHRRFSTNTVTSWDKAQPFRLIAHNGEINTIAGNRYWAYSCEKSIGLRQNELLTHAHISDSGSVNEMVEALRYRSSLPNVEDCLALMVPPAEKENSFYKFWGRAMEPWDGPALITFNDGQTIGARLDRNGFRPCRWMMTDENFYLASEAGSFEAEEENVIQKGALRAGHGLKVDLQTGAIDFRDPSQCGNNLGAEFDPRLLYFGYKNSRVTEFDLSKKYLFNFSEEEVTKIINPMIVEGKEPFGSMGDTARLAILSHEPRPFFDYLYQNFAQVTNPPLDYLREKMVTDLSVYLGERPNIFAKKELIPPKPAFELPGPVLSLGQMEHLDDLADGNAEQSHIKVRRFEMTFKRLYGAVDLQAQISRVAKLAVLAVKEGVSIIILSDRQADWDHLPIPALVLLQSVLTSLDKAGLRLKVSLVLDTGQIRTTHQLSAAISFGASAVCPHLALQMARSEPITAVKDLAPEKREKNLIAALESGLLKVMSKMGISVVRSYQGSRLFTVIGLAQSFCDEFFGGVPTLMGGLGLDEIVEEILVQAEGAEKAAALQKLTNTHQLREHPRNLTGEKHSMTSSKSRLIHQLVRDKNLELSSMELFDEYLKVGLDDEPVNVRHLLKIKDAKTPTPPEETQPLADILKKFGSGAMSFGAISAEAQRDIILAMAEIGGRSNSGEGGENPYYFSEGITASTKQIASARFGVTAQYLISSREIQIKMAQGAKPGEGGQLMAAKVNEDIARARHSMTHVDLISPPPMHDIYSIEDLKQLIYELKQLNPQTKVSVKLVSCSNIGTIAVGVAKAGADIIHVAGSDGGTGAAPISSMKHTGLPFEFGLLEIHKALIENNLREGILLRADGGLQNGRDIVTAAIMGAQEFDFGKLLLVAQGCTMARICEKNTCPTGIATHDPRFKAKYKGTKDHIVKLLQMIAEDVKRNLSRIGARTLEDVVGRTDLLEVNAKHLALINKRKLDLSFALRAPLTLKQNTPTVTPAQVSQLNQKLLTAHLEAGENDAVTFSSRITTCDRAVGTTLSGVIAAGLHKAHLEQFSGEALTKPKAPKKINLTFTGSAGQGFCAFLVENTRVRLYGEGNDSVCKTMSGGKVVITPLPRGGFKPEENVIIGNCALYGATGGTLYVHGIAGDRFAVRNSGALAVVEGTGLHACEYMTNGKVVILGHTAQNIGSGMTGGSLYLFGDHDDQVNPDFLVEVEMGAEEENELKVILQDYLGETGSQRAKEILLAWNEQKILFKKYLPKNLLPKAKPHLVVETTIQVSSQGLSS